MKDHDKEHTFVIAIFALLIVVVANLCTGCATADVTLNKAVTSAAVVAAGCYHELDSADTKRQLAIREQAKAGDAEGAGAALMSWQGTRGQVLLACSSIDTAARSAKAAIPIVKASKDKAAVAEWIAKLTKAALDVKQALLLVGVK